MTWRWVSLSLLLGFPLEPMAEPGFSCIEAEAAVQRANQRALSPENERFMHVRRARAAAGLVQCLEEKKRVEAAEAQRIREEQEAATERRAIRQAEVDKVAAKEDAEARKVEARYEAQARQAEAQHLAQTRQAEARAVEAAFKAHEARSRARESEARAVEAIVDAVSADRERPGSRSGNVSSDPAPPGGSSL